MDGREAMNMGSRTSNQISDVRAGISGIRQESSLLKQEWNNILSVMGSVGSRIKSFFGFGDRGDSGSLVAPNPRFSAPALTPLSYGSQGAGGTQVAAGPSSGVPAIPTSNLTQYVQTNPRTASLYNPMVGGGGIGGGGGGRTGFTGGFNDPYGGGGSNAASAAAAGVPGYTAGGGTPESTFFQTFRGNLAATLSNNPLATALAGAGVLSNLIPATADVVQANLLMQHAAFFGGNTYQDIVQRQNQISKLATLSTEDPQLDTMRSMAAAQSYGLISPNFQNVLTGAANISNILPGVGLEGTVRAYGSMQQARNVNMLRGIGIRIRDDQGNLKPPDQVVDDIWKKICRDYSQVYGRNTAPSLREIQIGLQPGNSLDSMLDLYFGNDPILKQLIANGLIYKARGGGEITQAGAQALGATTAAVISFTQRGAETAAVLAGHAEAGAGGFAVANNLLASLISSIGNLLANLLPIKTFIDTILSAAGGTGSDLLNLLAGIPGAPRAEGGPVLRNKTYLVGEKGPEIFVPTTSGMIIPNDQIQTNTSSNDTYNYNLTVNVPNANTPEVISAIKRLMNELETSKKVSES